MLPSNNPLPTTLDPAAAYGPPVAEAAPLSAERVASVMPEADKDGISLEEAYQAIKASHNRMNAALPQYGRTNTYVGALLDYIEVMEVAHKERARAAWHASGRITVSFQPYDLNYENWRFEKWYTSPAGAPGAGAERCEECGEPITLASEQSTCITCREWWQAKLQEGGGQG